MRSALVLAMVLTGCSSQSDKRAESVSAARSDIVTAAAPVISNPVPTVTADPCPHTGLWALCSVERRLRQAGFVAKRIDGKPQKRAGFSILPTAYTLGKSRLELFLYPDETSLSRDIAGLDTVLVSPLGTTTSQWGETSPILIRSANLAAVLLSASARQSERVALALTAGAPQPGSPR